MSMVALPFQTHAAAESTPTYLVCPLGVVEVDLSSMSEGICTEGDNTQLSPWWRDVAARIKVRSPPSTYFSLLSSRWIRSARYQKK